MLQNYRKTIPAIIPLPTKKWLTINWIHLILLCVLVNILVRKNVSLSISFNNALTTPSTSTDLIPPTPKAMQMSLFQPTKTGNNKKQQQVAYIKRFAKIAQQEMHKYGIPASITLAQGLLESNAGSSTLVSTTNNHFGIKCFSKNCKKGHCSNFSDDSHKDFFRVFDTAWASYRAHSELLQSKRYRHLKNTTYQNWAKGLVKAGYATDPKYGEKLIGLIEQLDLYKYDS